MVSFLRTYKHQVILSVLILFHTVGVIGLLSQNRPFFLALSPYNLLLSVTCLFVSYSSFSQKMLIGCLIVGIAGFFVEWIGVHTGYLFGNYTYGENLGMKVAGVPILIAVNWIMLSLCTTSIVVRMKFSVYFQAFVSALFMTLLDVFIEPVAVKSDFWHWENGMIPVSNYVCWFVISYIMHLGLLKWKTIEQNRVTIGLYVLLLAFFGILNLF